MSDRNWADYAAELVAERDTLRQQLAVSQAELEAERTVTLGQAADIARMAEQLAVARKGLGFYAKPETWYEYWTPEDRFGLSCLTSVAEQDEGITARDTLAKLDQMSQSRSLIGPMGEKP